MLRQEGRREVLQMLVVGELQRAAVLGRLTARRRGAELEEELRSPSNRVQTRPSAQLPRWAEPWSAKPASVSRARP